ncbi:GNAT family N-acetyltransferase [Streptomyces sp. NPDC058657]|uniref:GNAT family N-acetyltransferase n=1 Tax=unclassified Streptomyces TaxID=2593676 RepID=UPI00364ADFCD
MTIEVRPASVFEDVRAVIGPKSPGANVCWCLSYRLPAALNNTLRGPARGEYMAALCAEQPPPGVLAHDDGEPVGWAAVAPRAGTSFARSRSIPHVDDLPVWSLWCIRVRPGHRKRGISHALIAGAVEFARERGAPALEAYPLDNGGARVDLTMAYAGLRKNFERAGFVHAADTTSVLAGHPRILMRHDLGRTGAAPARLAAQQHQVRGGLRAQRAHLA